MNVDLCKIISREVQENLIRNLKVSSKLQIGFLFAIIITCLVGCIGIMGMQQISQADQSLYEQQTKISEKDISMDTLKAYTGDFAPVSQSVNTILDGLNDFFSMVQVSAEQVNSGSEQAAAMSEISQGVEQISAVIQMNSATSEESAAASEELSAQADMLKKELANFRLR